MAGIAWHSEEPPKRAREREGKRGSISVVRQEKTPRRKLSLCSLCFKNDDRINKTSTVDATATQSVSQPDKQTNVFSADFSGCVSGLFDLNHDLNHSKKTLLYDFFY